MDVRGQSVSSASYRGMVRSYGGRDNISTPVIPEPKVTQYVPEQVRKHVLHVEADLALQIMLALLMLTLFLGAVTGMGLLDANGCHRRRRFRPGITGADPHARCPYSACWR